MFSDNDLKQIYEYLETVPLGSPTDPVNVREPACFVSITPASLTANVYTVTGTPAKGIEVINDSAGEITVTVSDGTTSIVETSKPDDTYNQTFEIDVETVTFSAGAVFRADLLR